MNINSTQPEILVVDDDPAICELVASVAEEMGVHVVGAQNFKKFEQAFQRDRFTAILLDLIMPDKDGIEYLRLLGDNRCQVPVAIMSGYDKRVLQTARRFGVSRELNMACVLEKPFNQEDLKGFLDSVSRDDSKIKIGDIERGITENQFFLEFQPKVQLKSPAVSMDPMLWMKQGPTTWCVSSFEALVRWEHPQLGKMGPGYFIPICEENDLILPLTEIVNSQAIAQCRAWKESGHHVKVAVNWPAAILTDSAAPDRFASQVREAGLDCQQFIIEITETAAMADVTTAMDVLSRVRLKGFELSIDDFGTGYSSLTQLHRMPFSELKIDRSIISELGTSKEAKTIVETIVGLAHNLGLKVCSEGVEESEAYDFLELIGCDTAQGFLISAPRKSDHIKLSTSKKMQAL